MKLGSPTRLEIKPNAERTEFQFLLSFPEQPQPVEFSIQTEHAMAVMTYLQRFHVRHRVPIPRAVRPRGKPKLEIVLPDE